MPIKILDKRSEEEKVKGQTKRAANQALASYDTVLADLTDNWGGLNTSDKTQALRRGLVLALRAIRALWG